MISTVESTWILSFTSVCLNRSFSCVFLAENVVNVWGFASIHTRCEFRSKSLIFKTIFCVRVWALDRTVQSALDSRCPGFRGDIRRDLDEVKVLPWFLFGDSNRSFDSWPWISSGKPVSLLSFFSWSGSCEILHFFFSFFFSDLMPVITLAARYLRWRARVELQAPQFSDEDS